MSETTVGPTPEDRIREVEAALLRRLAAVERENAQLKRKSVALMASAAGILVLSLIALAGALRGSGSGLAEEIRAQRFVLGDDAGFVRGVMEVSEEGAARLALRDGDGRERIRLTLLRDGSPGITLNDRDGNPRLVAGVLPDQAANLVFADQAGRARAVLGLGPDQTASLLFADAGGATKAVLGVDAAGTTDFTMFEKPVASADTAGAAGADSTAAQQ